MIASWEAKAVEASSECARLSAELSELRAQSTRTQEDLEAVRAWGAAADEGLKSLERKREAECDDAEQCRSLLSQCQSDLSASLDRVAALQEALSTAQETALRALEAGEDHRSELESMHIRLEGLQRHNKDLELRCERGHVLASRPGRLEAERCGVQLGSDASGKGGLLGGCVRVCVVLCLCVSVRGSNSVAKT